MLCYVLVRMDVLVMEDVINTMFVIVLVFGLAMIVHSVSFGAVSSRVLELIPFV